MCGIFGIISSSYVDKAEFRYLARHAEQRGKDSSGYIVYEGENYRVKRADISITDLVKNLHIENSRLALGHSRLITNGLSDNQPVVRDNVCVFHNGIIVNHETIWDNITRKRELEIDTEVIAAIASEYLESDLEIESLPAKIVELCQGVVACALVLPKIGKLCLFSNNGSLYLGEKGSFRAFASEKFPLEKLEYENIEQIYNAVFIDIPISGRSVEVTEVKSRKINLVPGLKFSASEESLLEYRVADIRRCTKCVLPETMPFISFDADGVCNYCHNYTPRNIPRPKEELFRLVEPYRRKKGNDCIVPFSGGRDSCYGLHLIVNELKMKPVAYTYDWGMVTDLGRRNISRMCAKLGVENIIIADDITKKRDNIAKNLRAWLKSPHLGMISILTAGDKHFFRHIETIKHQTGINLNLWGVNPLEVTHFKAGFLGVPPYFEEKRVYTHGILKQLRYQFLRFKAMLQSSGYFNNSLWDTISGEYYRSFSEKSDYYHIFDYWRWDEKLIDKTLELYDWEKAPDTQATWRIGDGTAAFYNYIYYTVAGFTEHDTFRSNQIREGDMSREKALELINEENRPRYPNIRWYLDAIGLDFKEVIPVVNSIKRLY
jgi:hypothetical protein